MGVNTTTTTPITMRCAIFLAIACVAMSAPTTEENIQAEEVNPLTSEVNPLTSEVSRQEITTDSNALATNTDSNALATNGRKLLGGRRRRPRRCSARGNMVKWGGGRKRIGRHLYGQRMLYRWHCDRYIYLRWWWALLRRNYYNHHLHGRYQWRWTNSYRRIGVHRYRYQSLYRNYQGHWRRVGGKWRLNRKNAYYRKPRWFWGRRTKQHGGHVFRRRVLKRWTGAHWVKIRAYWRRIRRARRSRRGICARLYQHSNFRGKAYNVFRSVRFTRGFNDQMSSMRVFRGCRVRVYEHSNFRGRSRLINPGNYNYHWIRRHFGNDKLSSVRVRRTRRKAGAVAEQAFVQAPEQTSAAKTDGKAPEQTSAAKTDGTVEESE